MSPIAKAPPATKPSIDLFTGQAPSPDEGAVVLLRVRSLCRHSEEPGENARAQEVQTLVSAAEPEPAIAAPTAEPPVPAAEPASQFENPQATRRQRQQGKTGDERRQWNPTLWQGTVGLLLLILLGLVCFMLARGGKKDATIEPAINQSGENHKTADELQSPEISFPEPIFGVSQRSEEASKTESFAPRIAEPSVAPSSAARELKRDIEGAREGLRGSEDSAYGERPAMRETARPLAPAGTYPVTPAQAIYPATDPGKFRYPDDTRPGAASGAGNGRSNEFDATTRGGSEWDERERVVTDRPEAISRPPIKRR